MTIFLSLAVVILFLAQLAMTAMLSLMIWGSIFTKVPFVSVSKKIILEIIKLLNLQSNSTLYDLGCGDGRVLIECQKQQPLAKFIGLDKDILPFWRAKWNTKKLPITILRKDFFKCDLSDATHIFTYLSIKFMDELLPKLQKELRPGTRLVSCDFPFSQKKPMQTLHLIRPKNSLGKTLYIYEF